SGPDSGSTAGQTTESFGKYMSGKGNYSEARRQNSGARRKPAKDLQGFINMAKGAGYLSHVLS
ncbi:MAG: hypothetical protein Q7J12_00545, partial [Syntrophales bacterium]|nr:hypothetical protein [Syntrophales bacterium]